MTLKVYQGSTDGRTLLCVAANSWAAAHRAVEAVVPNASLGYMRNMWSVTGNENQVSAAMSEPGTVFGSVNRWGKEPYKPMRSPADVYALTREFVSLTQAGR